MMGNNGVRVQVNNKRFHINWINHHGGIALIFLSLPKAVSLLRTFKKKIPDMADALTAQFDTVFGILLILAIFCEAKVIL